MKTVLAVMIALAGAGCLRTTTYKCTSNDMCTGTGGTCENTGFCSFADGDCAEGRRYGDLAGKFSGTCVGDLPLDIDGGVDAPGDGPMGDAPITNNCPSTYVAITGQTHRYRVISTLAAYANQLADCDDDAVGTTTYLAIPDDQTELTAILAAATGDAWVGIDDLTTEGSFVTGKGAAFSSTSPLWAGGEPNDNPESGGGAANCVAGFDNNNRLYDDRCTNTFVAVCECDP